MSFLHHIHPKENNDHHTIFEKIWFIFQKQPQKTKINIEIVSAVLIIGIIAFSVVLSNAFAASDRKATPEQNFIDLPITSSIQKK